MLRSLFLASLLTAAPLAVHARQPAVEHPIGHAGALVSFSDSEVILRDKDGKVVAVGMAPGWTVVTSRALSLESIRSGDFVATINTDIDAGAGRATELRLFEPGYRPEVGTHAVPQPGVSITHGTVTAVRRTEAGLELDVAYPGGARRIEVPGSIKPIAYDVHPRGFAKPGMNVSAVTRRDGDGAWRAGRIMVQP